VPLSDALAIACNFLREADPSPGALEPAWYPLAIENGKRRKLNETEMATLVASFEQEGGGARARLEPVDEL
jgi:hypothetical protein